MGQMPVERKDHIQKMNISSDTILSVMYAIALESRLHPLKLMDVRVYAVYVLCMYVTNSK